MPDSVTQSIARFAADLRYDQLSAEVVLMAKRLTLDTLGTALAATALGEGCREVLSVITALGGIPQSTIFGQKAKVSAANAAFANGALAHALNYDAGGKETGHLGLACLPAPLALAEARSVSGRDFLSAVVVAAEVTARVTAAATLGERHFSDRLLAGQYCGYFGAAAGAGKVLDLNGERMHSALGLALMQVSGSREVLIGGDPPAKAIYGAFPNHGATIAALLAEAGLGAEIDALDGKAGFYAMAARGQFGRDVLLDGLASAFRFLHAQFKPWPASGYVIPFIEAGIELAGRFDVHDSDIDAVTVVGAPVIRDWCEPVDERRRPPNGAAAANSALYAAAKALVNRTVTLADFTDVGLHDERTLAVAARTSYRFDDSVDREGGVLEVDTIDGRKVTLRIDKPLGHRLRPMTGAQLVSKFRDCCSHVPALSDADVRALIDFVDRIEESTDAGVLAALSCGSAETPLRH